VSWFTCPELDGFETATQLRLSGTNRETPVVFVTSLTDSASQTKAEASGANGFICKPVLPAEIALLSLTFATGRGLGTRAQNVLSAA
jgi:CheY-like chemotaxis protein